MTWLYNNLAKDFERFNVGFDRIFKDTFETAKQIKPSFPFYNIARKDDDHTYLIEMAVAGFSKHDIEVELDGDILRVRGSIKEKKDLVYTFKGLSHKSFIKEFTVYQGADVESVTLVNGMLTITLKYMMDKKKPVRINISDEPDTVSEFAANNPQLLTEDALSHTQGKLM